MTQNTKPNNPQFYTPDTYIKSHKVFSKQINKL